MSFLLAIADMRRYVEVGILCNSSCHQDRACTYRSRLPQLARELNQQSSPTGQSVQFLTPYSHAKYSKLWRAAQLGLTIDTPTKNTRAFKEPQPALQLKPY